MAVYHEAGSVLSASEMNQTVQATTASLTDQAHCLQADEDTFTITAGAPDSGTLLFDVSFVATPIIVASVQSTSSGSANLLRLHTYDHSANGFTWRVNPTSGTPTISGTVQWMAFGQITPP